MGSYASVYAKCPTCGKIIEFQSKEGECQLNNYTVDDAPANVLWDVLNEPHYCCHCGEWSCLFDPQFPPKSERPKPEPKMVKVRQANTPQTHSTQSELRWWKEPFTSDDIIRRIFDHLPVP